MELGIWYFVLCTCYFVLCTLYFVLCTWYRAYLHRRDLNIPIFLPFFAGGTMCTHYAGTAPEFFLHHAFLDKIWFMWQKRSSKHKFANFGNSRQKLMGFLHEARDLVDSHNLPGSIKVTYSKFPEERIVKRSVKHHRPEYIDGMLR